MWEIRKDYILFVIHTDKSNILLVAAAGKAVNTVDNKVVARRL